MPLEIAPGDAPASWQNDTGTRLYLTTDTPPRVVPEGDPAAAFLLVGAGGRIPIELAERHGLVLKNPPSANPSEKAKAPPANKARPAPGEQKDAA